MSEFSERVAQVESRASQRATMARKLGVGDPRVPLKKQVEELLPAVIGAVGGAAKKPDDEEDDDTLKLADEDDPMSGRVKVPSSWGEEARYNINANIAEHERTRRHQERMAGAGAPEATAEELAGVKKAVESPWWHPADARFTAAALWAKGTENRTPSSDGLKIPEGIDEARAFPRQWDVGIPVERHTESDERALAESNALAGAQAAFLSTGMSPPYLKEVREGHSRPDDWSDDEWKQFMGELRDYLVARAAGRAFVKPQVPGGRGFAADSRSGSWTEGGIPSAGAGIVGAGHAALEKEFKEWTEILTMRAAARGLRQDRIELKKEIRQLAYDAAAQTFGVRAGEPFATRNRDGHLVRGHLKSPEELGLKETPPEAVFEATARWMETKRARPWSELQKGY